MTVERFGVRGMEFVLAPGLNLLVCPSEDTLSEVWAGLREALLAEVGPALSAREYLDAYVISGADWRAFARIASHRPIAEAVMAAGMLGGRRLPELKLTIRRNMESLYAPKARAPALNRALNELGQVQRQLKQIGDPAAHVSELKDKLAALGSRHDAARAQLERVDAERQLMTVLDGILNELAQYEALQTERGRLKDVSSFPRDGVDRLAHLKERLALLEKERTRLLSTAPERAVRAGTAPGHAEADGIADRIAILLDVQRLWDVQLRTLPDHIDEVSRRRREIDELLAMLDRGAKPRQSEIAESARAALEEGGLSLANRRVFSDTATAVRDRVESEVRRLTNEALALAPRLTSAQVHAELAALEQLPTLRDRVEDDTRSARTTQAQRKQLEASTPAEPRLRFGVLPALAVSVISVALGAAIIALGPTAWRLHAIGATVAAVAMSVLVSAWMRRRYARARAGWELRRTIHTQASAAAVAAERDAQERLQASRHSLDAAAQQAGVPADAGLERIEARRHALGFVLSQVERREEIARQMEAYAALIAAASQEENRARVDRHVAEARLSAMQRELGPSPEKVPPDRLPAVLRKRLTQLRVEETALAADWNACARAGELVLQAARALGLKVRELTAVPEALEGLRASLVDEAARLRRERIAQADHDSAMARCLNERADVAEALRGLLRDGGARDEVSFARRSQEAVRLDEVERDSTLLEERLVASSGMKLPQLRRHVEEAGGPSAVTRKRARLTERSTRLSGQVARVAQEIARSRTQLEQWERGDAVEGLRRREATLHRDITRLLDAYAAERLALGLAERRMGTWRRAHRARVIEIASRALGRLTNGEMVHVGLVDEHDESLIVTDAALRQLRPEELPRRVRELLYLSFRWAAIDEHGERIRPLPVVFNGALAGFAAEDLTRLARVLAVDAEHRQIVVLTRQPLVREMFEAEGAHAVEVDDLEMLSAGREATGNG